MIGTTVVEVNNLNRDTNGNLSTFSAFKYKTNYSNTAQSIGGNSTIDVFTDNNPGLLHWAALKFNHNNHFFRLEVDGNNDFEVWVRQLNWEFQSGDFYNMMPIGYVIEGGNHVVMFHPKFPVQYDTSLKVQAHNNTGSSKNLLSYWIGYSNL